MKKIACLPALVLLFTSCLRNDRLQKSDTMEFSIEVTSSCDSTYIGTIRYFDQQMNWISVHDVQLPFYAEGIYNTLDSMAVQVTGTAANWQASSVLNTVSLKLHHTRSIQNNGNTHIIGDMEIEDVSAVYDTVNFNSTLIARFE